MKPRNMKLYIRVTSPRTEQLMSTLATAFDYTEQQQKYKQEGNLAMFASLAL